MEANRQKNRRLGEEKLFDITLTGDNEEFDADISLNRNK